MQSVSIWHKKTHETPAQYTAFMCYLGLNGKRTIRAAFEAYKHPNGSVKPASKERTKRRVSGYFGKWAIEYQWQKRAIAYDEYLNGEHDKQSKASIEAFLSERKALYREASCEVLDAIRNRVKSGVDVQMKDLRELLMLLDSEFLESQRVSGNSNSDDTAELWKLMVTTTGGTFPVGVKTSE
jgi:hypothetical protein